MLGLGETSSHQLCRPPVFCLPLHPEGWFAALETTAPHARFHLNMCWMRVPAVLSLPGEASEYIVVRVCLFLMAQIRMVSLISESMVDVGFSTCRYSSRYT